MHHRLAALFPGVELSEAAAMEELETEAARLKTVRERTHPERPDHTKLMTRRLRKFYEGVDEALRENFEEEVAGVGRDGGAGRLAYSKSPLNDFAKNRIEMLSERCDDSDDEEELETMNRLLAMRTSSMQ